MNRFFCVVSVLLITLVGGCGRAALPRVKIGIWYWHSPFQLTAQELTWVKKIGISTIYVRAATLTTDGMRIKTMIPQQWRSNAGGVPVVLTFNFDSGLGSHFKELANSTIAPDVIAGIVRERTTALGHGIHVTGVQMDVDCPTRLLPKYADLLVKIRAGLLASKALVPGDSFSSTALQTWLNSRDYQELADACDFVVPQFYEGRTGHTINTVQPISDASNLARGMDHAESAGKPFFVGLGIYGHSLLYNERGALIGMYHGMQPEDALRHPSLKLEKQAAIKEGSQNSGEHLLVLRAVRPDLNGRGLGYRIAYVLPGAEMLTRELKIFEESRSSHCQGIILYRFPELADELSLPLPTIAQALSNHPATLEIKPTITGRAVPWSLIGTDKVAKRPPYEFTLAAESIGTAPTLPGPDALTMMVRFDHAGLEGCEPGDFDRAATGRFGRDGSFTACAPAHANAVLFRRFDLRPGARIKSGPIEVGPDGPIPTEIVWEGRSGSGPNSGIVPVKKSYQVRGSKPPASKTSE